MEATAGTPATNRDFSDELEEWLESDGDKTVGGLIDTFDERSFAVTIMLLLFVPALPLPTAGISHILEFAAVLVAAQMVLGRHAVWLPERILRRELGEIMTGKAIPFMLRRVRWFERFSEPRGAGLFERTWFLRILGLVLIGCAVGSALAPPFSMLDTLPSLGGVVICLSIVLGDVVVLGIGGALAAAGIALIVTLGAAAARFVTGLF
ncbi:MAG TPA: exopolysaccharide biosynthesis protein [Acidimicrobiales bacterium]